MSISKRKHFLPLTVTGIAMAAGVLYLAVYLAAGIPEEQREYQEIVSFGKTVYDQKLLKEVQKIDGLFYSGAGDSCRTEAGRVYNEYCISGGRSCGTSYERKWTG